MIRLFLVFVFFLSMSSFSIAGNISSMRCGNGFIERGMSFDQVKKECGRKWKPAKIDRFSRQKADPRFRNSDGTIPVSTDYFEMWTYAVYGRFIVYVTFDNGRIVRIFETSKRR